MNDFRPLAGLVDALSPVATSVMLVNAAGCSSPSEPQSGSCELLANSGGIRGVRVGHSGPLALALTAGRPRPAWDEAELEATV